MFKWHKNKKIKDLWELKDEEIHATIKKNSPTKYWHWSIIGSHVSLVLSRYNVESFDIAKTEAETYITMLQKIGDPNLAKDTPHVKPLKIKWECKVPGTWSLDYGKIRVNLWSISDHRGWWYFIILTPWNAPIQSYPIDSFRFAKKEAEIWVKQIDQTEENEDA